MYAFGDGFDLYASTNDIQSFWDTYSNGSGPPGLVVGRFSGGQALDMTATSCYLVKASSHNDAVHHLTIAVKLTGSISGATIGTPYISFTDGATNQCSVVFRTDGAMLLTSGAYNGTVLDTLLGAVTIQNQWFVFEIEVVVNNTTGSWSVKKNGNVGTPDRTLGSLNTRGGTSNNYANGLTIGFAGGGFQIDDVLWRSDPLSVPWIGDVRTYLRFPASDVSAQFTRGVASPLQQTHGGSYSSNNWGSTVAFYSQFVCQYPGQITGATFNVAGTGGNLKAALYSDNAGVPGTIIAQPAAPIVNTSGGLTTFTWTTPLTVVAGQKIWVAFMADSGGLGLIRTNTNDSYSGQVSGASYASFPQANPSPTIPAPTLQQWLNYAPLTTNAACVGQTQQDGLTTYVYDSNVGDADLYSIGSISVVPASTVAVTTRQLAQKSDAGSRSGMVQLKSGSTTVNSGSAPLNTSWAWNWRTDLTDPATSAVWTATGVNNAQVGPTVTV